MVASVRELVNIQLPTSILSPTLSIHCPVHDMDEDVDMVPTRGRTPVGFKNTSRDSSIISATSSKPYYEWMEDQNHNALWFNQVEDEYNYLSLDTNVGESNTSNDSTRGNNSKEKQHASNEALALNNICPPHVESMDDSQHTL